MPGLWSFTFGFMITFGSMPNLMFAVMLSTPPPMATSNPSLMISCAATEIACSPEEQCRLTVKPGTVAGKPARMSATRATLLPCCPNGWPQPMTTSSISAGSNSGTLRRRSWMQWAARSSGRVRLNEPRKDFARGVRELATMTASLINAVGQLARNGCDPAIEFVRLQGKSIRIEASTSREAPGSNIHHTNLTERSDAHALPESRFCPELGSWSFSGCWLLEVGAWISVPFWGEYPILSLGKLP